MPNRLFPLLSLLLSLSLSGPLFAEQGDRSKPITLEADRITVDDLKGEQILDGNVILTQGTLSIRSDRIVITEDAQGFQRGVAHGGPDGLARFRQRRDDGAWVEGEGERIEYDSRTEVAELFKRAWIRNGNDELKSDYIWYDGLTARYLAAANKDKTEAGERPVIVLQPKNAAPPPAPASLPLAAPSSIGAETSFPVRPAPR